MAANTLEREILEFLAGHNVVHLVTSGEDGVHCASLFYATTDIRCIGFPIRRHGIRVSY
jgi:uncharacterized protein YhbP (UPF0306 family)